MNAPVKAEATEADKITAAIGALLVAILSADNAPSLLPDRAAVGFKDAVAEFDQMMGWTQAQRQTDRLLNRPVSQALRNAVRTLGRRLHEIGGLGAMHDAMMTACEHKDSWVEGKLESVVDHAWDGIGEWMS